MSDGDRVVVTTDEYFADDEPQDPLAFFVAELVEAVGEAGEEAQMPRARGVSAHPAVVEAKKVQPLPAFCQVHDPRLGVP